MKTGSSFSPIRLQLYADALAKRVEDGKLPGAMAWVGTLDALSLKASIGFRDREAATVMAEDAIFRIASMTKPITSLAAMLLVEEGRISLADAVADCLPALANLKVGVARAGGGVDIAPCARPPTILDLMRHTAGMTYGWIGNSELRQLHQSAGLDQFAGTAGEYIAKLAEVPLQFQPGEAWGYSIATDVLGHVVEAVSGQTLADFVASRITGPLGMRDTGFSVEAGAHGRIAEPQIDPQTGGRPPLPDKREPPRRFGGGGGMVSTAADYARFCQFWLNGGVLDGTRLISRKTHDLMLSDNLPPGMRGDVDCGAFFGPWLPTAEFGQGFGLGFAIRTCAGRTPWHGSVGDYGWMGAFGCLFWVDRGEGLFSILLTQAPDQLISAAKLARSLVYQALD